MNLKSGINLVSENKIIEPNTNSEEPRLFNGLNNDENVKEINLGIRPTIKKIENIEKIEKIDTNQNEEKKQIEDLLRPVNKNTNLININPNTRKLKQKNFIKKKLLGGNKLNSSFYQKYDENLANYNYTSESYLDEDDNNISKNKLNLNYNSSDDEDNNVVELV